MLFAVVIQYDQGGSPFYLEIRGQGLGIKGYAHWDKMFLDEFDHLALWIRNRIHLLAANSIRVKKIEQNEFFPRPSPGQGSLHLGFPLDLVFHLLSPPV